MMPWHAMAMAPPCSFAYLKLVGGYKLAGGWEAATAKEPGVPMERFKWPLKEELRSYQGGKVDLAARDCHELTHYEP